MDLPEDQCWLLGPHEGRLAALQERETPGEPRRVRLRELFHPSQGKRGRGPGKNPPAPARSSEPELW